MPTLGGPSAGPEFAGPSKQGDEALAAAQAEFESLWPTMMLMAATIAQRAEENFPSTAYGPYLKERGADPVWAQSLGSLAISLGTRRSNKSRQIGVVVEALRFLAQGKRQRRAVLSRARLLLAAQDETSMLDEIFRKAGLNGTELSELVYLLKGGVNGEPLERDRIREMAAAVVSSFPSARGRRVSAASAAHEEFLKFARIVGPYGLHV